MRITGGLPVEEIDGLDFPTGLAGQDYYFGAPIPADELRELPLKQRLARVLDAMNGLGPELEEESPHASNAVLAAAVAHAEKHLSHPAAVISEVLRGLQGPSPETRQLLALLDGDATEAGEWVRQLAEILRVS